MKLHVLTGRYYLFVSMIILAVMGIVLFYMLRWVFNNEMDEKLHSRAEMLFRSLEDKEVITAGENTKIIMTAKSGRPFEEYRDTTLFIQGGTEAEPYRLLEAQREIKGKTYLILTWASRLEWDDFLEVILWIFLATAVLLFGVQWLVNRKILNKLWRPFFSNLGKLKTYSVRQPTLPDFERSPVDEFESFRDVAIRFSEQARDEFLAVRHFSENAAHELQTPLAIIRNKLEQVSQNEALPEDDLRRISEAMEAGNRLSKLNRALLLLTKLENGQFSVDETIDISRIIRKYLDEMTERFMMRKISLTMAVEENVLVKGNGVLAETLVSNLLQNMLRHTGQHGKASIELSHEKVIFRNTGEPEALDSSAIFERFRKSDATTGGTGLGLAIVREIGQVLHWQITYHFEEDEHVFTVRFTEL
jgi:signal transduction histidine kinase